nr:MAG TPA: hypothetical protein [Bacteriophage sp.]
MNNFKFNFTENFTFNFKLRSGAHYPRMSSPSPIISSTSPMRHGETGNRWSGHGSIERRGIDTGRINSFPLGASLEIKRKIFRKIKLKIIRTIYQAL